MDLKKVTGKLAGDSCPRMKLKKEGCKSPYGKNVR